jgi:serine/threonine protein kinase
MLAHTWSKQMVLKAGDAIGSYEIVSQIGAGGMAMVYKAYQPKLDRFVAIKMMHESFSQDENFMARFEREARIVARLDYPHIVPVYDYDNYENQPYLVMKIVEGQTLKQQMRNNPPSIDELLIILDKIGKALHYAHEAGVLHRDIKPSNIIIDERGEPYLTDFGLARITHQGESTMSVDTMLGTPHYISPEQAKGETNLDARTDVYSLGVVLYELVTGRVPFIADTSYAIIHDQIYKAPPLPSELDEEISPNIEAVLLKALAKNAEDRYATPVALVDDFRRAVTGESSLAQRWSGKSKRAAPPIPQPPAVPAPYIPQPAPPDPISDRSAFGRQRGQSKQHRRELRTARKHIRRELKRARTDARRGLQRHDVHQQVERYAWRPGKRWTEDVHGRKGFYSQEELDAMDASLTDEDRIRLRVEKRIEARKEIYIHILMYFMVNIMLWVIWALTMPGEFMWPLIVMAGWGIGLAAHTGEYYMQYGAGREKAESRMQREIERERRRMYGDSAIEKGKNEDYFDPIDMEERQVRLTEDGEFTESFVDEQFDDERWDNQNL